MAPPFSYRFNRFEPALFVEIYLPKKIRYQGTLYTSLRTGFDFEQIKRHLITPDHFAKISEFLEDYDTIYDMYKRNDITEITERVAVMQQSFSGYSMYEVDGVFFNHDQFVESSTKKTVPINMFIAEENVQVIRMIFKPKLTQIFDDVHATRNHNSDDFYGMGFLRQALDSQYQLDHELKRKEAQAKTIGDEKLVEILKTQRKIFDKIINWIDDVALFLFGFVMYKICEEIHELAQKDERPEDEIWVTSFWNCSINRITRR